jgi:RimJ/RimL family protein N-acetyltransferase
LRPDAFEDAEALHRAFSDAASMHWWTHAPYETLDQTRTELATPRPGWRRWIVTRAPSDVAIGLVSAGEKRQGNVREVGYLLVPEARGCGYAGEALAAVLNHLFAEGQRKVVADVDPDNRASRALLERLGFQLEGMLRGEWETHIGVRDTALYGLLREDWRGGA